jgi:hypothetical protein
VAWRKAVAMMRAIANPVTACSLRRGHSDPCSRATVPAATRGAVHVH